MASIFEKVLIKDLAWQKDCDFEYMKIKLLDIIEIDEEKLTIKCIQLQAESHSVFSQISHLRGIALSAKKLLKNWMKLQKIDDLPYDIDNFEKDENEQMISELLDSSDSD